MRSCACLLFVTLLTGCQYERSFMNLNSDSGSPFLGLQLSVDARETSRARSRTDAIPVALNAIERDVAAESKTLRAQSSEWTPIPTTDRDIQPITSPLTEPATSDPIDEITRRLAAF